MLILRALAAHPHRHLLQRTKESILGLALVCQLSLDSDYQACLDASENRTGALLSILGANREHDLSDILRHVAALGPEVGPRLAELLDPDGSGWGAIRIAHAIERIARLHPGACDAAIKVLIEAINDDQGDFIREACSDALEAIGAAAVQPIAQRLREDDSARRIYLTSVLGKIPTESAAQAILSWIADGLPVEEMHITSLNDIGSPSAVEPLYALWKQGHHLDRLLAEALLVLCQLHGVRKPELPEWRRVTEAQQFRFSQALAGQMSGIVLTDSASSKKQPLTRPGSRAQPTGKRKRKRKGKRNRTAR